MTEEATAAAASAETAAASAEAAAGVSYDVVPEGIPPAECRHLVIMLHGLGGNSGDWHAVLAAIRTNWDCGASVMVVRTNLAARDIAAGIEHAARLVLQAVKEAVETTFPKDHDLECSLVTLSFGGLYGRYLVKLMVDEGLLCGGAPTPSGRRRIRASTFISIASPHLGVRFSKTGSFIGGLFGGICHGALNFFVGKALEELLLEDERPHMLCRLTQGEFISALSIFRKRACYANVSGDIQVPFFTAAIEYNSPFEHCSDSDLGPRLEGCESIIDTGAWTNKTWPDRDMAYFAGDPKKDELAAIRDNLHAVGWSKFCCVLPTLPNAHNAIVGNCLVKSQGLDVADHIAKTVLEHHLEALEVFVAS